MVLCIREWRRAGRALGALVLLAGCGAPAPARFTYGDDQCAQCHMTLVDPRFSAQLVTRRHRVYRFDDPGCLANFMAGGTVPAADVGGAWVSDYLRPDSLLRVEDAVFLRSNAIRTPMDHRLAALRPGPAADSLAAVLKGELVRWDAVVAQATPARVLAGAQTPVARELVVSPGGPIPTVADALRLSRPGDRIVVRPGTYRMPRLVLDRGWSWWERAARGLRRRTASASRWRP
jgi:copper chaperone NosL